MPDNAFVTETSKPGRRRGLSEQEKERRRRARRNFREVAEEIKQVQKKAPQQMKDLEK